MGKFLTLAAVAVGVFGLSQFMPEWRIDIGQNGRLIALVVIVLVGIPAVMLSQRESEEKQNSKF